MYHFFIMLKILLIIGTGGFLGSIMRYLIFTLDNKFYQNSNFPLGTLIVNLTGSFLIGIALGVSIKYNLAKNSLLQYLFVTGFLGSFTTFSTFSIDSFKLLTEKNYLFFIGNILINVAGGIILASLGYLLITKKIVN